MTVPVQGLIVFVDAGSITRRAPAGGGEGTPKIEVVPDRELLAMFASRAIFSPEQVERIVEKAVRPEIWHRAPADSTVGRHISQEFEALEAAVGARLAQPVARPSASPRPLPTRPSRTTTVRPPTRRPSRGRKPRQSALEKLIRGLVMPAAGFAIAWGVLNYFTHR